METYLLTFSINLGKNLKKTYTQIIDRIRSYEDYVKITKTTFLVRSSRSAVSIRTDLEKILNGNDTDGTILILEVSLSGWALHVENDPHIAEWMRKHVSKKK